MVSESITNVLKENTNNKTKKTMQYMKDHYSEEIRDSVKQPSRNLGSEYLNKSYKNSIESLHNWQNESK